MTTPSATVGFIWKTLEQFGVLAIQFVLQIVIARILMPDVYGIVAIIGVFISIANIFVQCGFSTAIVQKKNIDSHEVSAVFNFSLIIGILAYLILFVGAPFIERFFSMQNLASPLRVMAIAIFPGLYNSVQISLLRRSLRFKEIFITSMCAVCISGIVGVLLAYSGYGVWALVWQNLIYSVTTVLILFIIIKWFPKPIWKFGRIKPLIKFGSHVLLTNIVDEIVLDIRTFVIGKIYNSSSLAFFNRGKSFPDIVIRSLNGSLQAVLLPVLSRKNDSEFENAIGETVKRTVSVSCFVVFPILALIMSSANNYVTILLTEKWLPCVPYIQIFCIYYLTWPITTSNIQALLSKGHSALVLKLETIRKILDILILFVTMTFGIKAIAWGVAAVSLLGVPLYLYPAKKYYDYSFWQQLKDISPSLFLSAICALIIWGVGLIDINIFAGLALQVVIGTFGYIYLARIMRFKAYNLVRSYVKSIIKLR